MEKILTPELYAIAREAHTQPAFTGKYLNKNPKSTYYCAVCSRHWIKPLIFITARNLLLMKQKDWFLFELYDKLTNGIFGKEKKKK